MGRGVLCVVCCTVCQDCNRAPPLNTNQVHCQKKNSIAFSEFRNNPLVATERPLTATSIPTTSSASTTATDFSNNNSYIKYLLTMDTGEKVAHSNERRPQTGNTGNSAVDLEPVLEALGTKGRYQVVQMCLHILGSFTVVFPGMAIVFIGYQPDYQCKETYNNTVLFEPYLEKNSPNATLLSADYQQCSIDVKLNASHRVTSVSLPCVDGVNFSMPSDTSILTEWQLVCDKAGLTELSQTLVMGGMTLGSIVFSTLADRYGRKKIYVFGGYTTLLTSACASVAPNYYVLLLARVLSGFFLLAIEMSSYTMFMELAPQRWRFVSSGADSALYSSGAVVMAILAYLMQGLSWRYLNLAFSAAFLYTLILPCILDESLRWLISRGKMTEVERILRRASRMNGKNYEDVHRALMSTVNKASRFSEQQDESYTKDETRDQADDHESDVRHLAKHQCHAKREEDTGESGNGLTAEVYPLIRLSNVTSVHDMILPPSTQQTSSAAAESGKDSEVVSHVEGDEDGEEGRADTSLQPEIVYELETQVCDEAGHQYNVLDLFRHWVVLRPLLVVTFVWISNNLYFYGVTLGSANLHGDRFLNFGILVVLDIPANILALFLMPRFRRKTLATWFGLSAGLSLLLSVVLVQLVSNETGLTIARILQYFGKFSLQGSSSLLYIYVLEVFPTGLRSSGMGFASALANMFSMSAPFLVLLGEKIAWAPGVIMGCLCILSTLSVRFLPETRHRNLPNTIDEMKTWTSRPSLFGSTLVNLP